jgi:hypothetical protein
MLLATLQYIIWRDQIEGSFVGNPLLFSCVSLSILIGNVPSGCKAARAEKPKPERGGEDETKCEEIEKTLYVAEFRILGADHGLSGRPVT